MNHEERRLIDGLFTKLRQAEQQSAPRDAEAERHIAATITQQPAAPYYMSQVILVQEQALSALTQRVEELEHALAERPAGGQGFLGGLFGTAPAQAASTARPAGGRQLAAAETAGRGWSGSGTAATRPNAGGGFMGSALQTALGVAGGVLLANALTGLFASGDVEAAEPSTGAGGEPDAGDDVGEPTDGGDFELFDDF